MNNILITSSGGSVLPDLKPELLKVPEIRLPDRHSLHDPSKALPLAMALSLVNREIRGMCALVEALGSKVEAIARSTHPHVFSTKENPFRFENLGEIVNWYDRNSKLIEQTSDSKLRQQIIPLLRGASRHMELVETAVLKSFGESFVSEQLLKLICALRTWAEEGVLGDQKPTLAHLVNYILLMRRECGEVINTDRKSYGKDTPKVPDSFVIKEFDPSRITPGSSLLENIEALYRELMIDPKQFKPQKGFLLLVTAEELAADLTKPGARLFIPYYDRKPIGFCLIFTDSKSFPLEARQAICSATASTEFPSNIDGWGKIIGLSVESRESLNRGYNPYLYLTECLMESARTLGLQRLWCDVRIGVQANPAIKNHFAVGWKDSGISHVCNTHPYQILVAHPFENAFSETGWVSSLGFEQALKTDWISEFNQLCTLYKDFSRAESPASKIPDFNGFEGHDQARIKQIIEDQLERKVSLKFFEPNGARDYFEIRIVPDTKQSSESLAIRQKIPGKDLWKLEEWDYYLLGNGKPLMSFEEILSNLARLRER